MAVLELVRPEPDWISALGVALALPPGVSERRTGEDPWAPPPTGRPRRISDDLAWFRDAVDEPEAYGLHPVTEASAVGAWQTPDGELIGRLTRLRDRGVLDAAGFLLHDGDVALL